MLKTKESILRHSNFIIGLVFFFIVMFSLLWGYNQLVDWVENKNDAPIDQVMIHGELNYLDRSELQAQIIKKLDGSFFTLEVESLRYKIEENPWVYAASIRKEWPQKIHVYIVEQDVFAVWNNDLLINKFGDVFYANDIAVPKSLPQLYGSEGNEKEVLKGYVKMQHLLDLYDFKISEVVLSERHAWQLWLNTGIHINLGRSDKMKRLQRFVDLYPLMSKYDNKEVARVDLRYDTGLAVSWREQSHSKSSETESTEKHGVIRG